MAARSTWRFGTIRVLMRASWLLGKWSLKLGDGRDNVDFNPDYRDLFFELNTARARYLVVGGYAVIYHSEPRYTKDIDVLISPTPQNARRVLAALKRFGAPIDNLSEHDLSDPELVIQLGVAPNRVDILMKIKGVTFDTAWKKRLSIRYADQRVWMIDVSCLRRAKLAAGRPQDLADLEALRTIKRI